ncbi:MAG: DUF169 domain-containing protein [bacterium]|nr:MAG: DUF169 domain-containing protein [bacterium]
MSEDIRALSEAIARNVRPGTFPVAVKLARHGEEITQRSKSPVSGFGHPIAVCQGLTIARTFGWTLVFGREDHACLLASVSAGHIEPDLFLQGEVADLYQDDPEVARRMEAGYPRHDAGSIDGIWLSPLDRCEFVPDLAVIYGNPAQILVLIHAANYGYGDGVRSASTGRFGCATWIAGAVQSGECTYMVPCSGERVFAGTQDQEMSFIVPRSKFKSLTEGLAVMRKKGTYRYPVPNMSLMSEPKLPPRYRHLDPGEKP